MLTLSCKLVHFISHARIVEVVIQQEEKWCPVGLSLRLCQSLDAVFPCSPVDLTAARLLSQNLRFLQEVLNAAQHCLSVQLPFSLLERGKKTKSLININLLVHVDENMKPNPELTLNNN